MTAPDPRTHPAPFSATELDGSSGVAPEDLAGASRVARDLELLAGRTPTVTSPDFTDRVMGAIAMEPAPAPARVATRALRRGAIGALVLSLRDAWRVSFGSGFPMAARAQAFALVMVFAVLATGSGMATAGALGLLGDANQRPVPSGEPSPEPGRPSPEPTADPSRSPDGSTEPSPSPDASSSADPSASAGESEDPEASERPDGTDDGGGGGGGDRETPRPTETPDDDDDDHTPSPTETPDDTPEPSRTPRPSDTPDPSDDSGD